MFASAALAALAVWLLIPGSPRHRARRMFVEEPASATSRNLPESLSRAAPWVLALGLLVLVGPPLGLILGLASIVLVGPMLRRLQARADVERARDLARQVPATLDLLVATLASGAPLERSVRAVADAQDEPIRSLLLDVAGALNLGASPAQAWARAGEHADLVEVANAFSRSADTGAPIAGLLAQAAAELRRRRHVRVTVAARQAGVQSFIPLGLCFLPAFVLLAGVPLVVTMAQGTGLLDTFSP